MKYFKIIVFIGLFLLAFKANTTFGEFTAPYRKVKLPVPDDAILVGYGFNESGEINSGFQKALTSNGIIAELSYRNLTSPELKNNYVISVLGDTATRLIDMTAFFQSSAGPNDGRYVRYAVSDGKALIEAYTFQIDENTNLVVGIPESFIWVTDGTNEGTRLIFSSTTNIQKYFPNYDTSKVIIFPTSAAHILGNKILLLSTYSYSLGVNNAIYDLSNSKLTELPRNTPLGSLAIRIDFSLFQIQPSLVLVAPNGRLLFLANPSGILGLYSANSNLEDIKPVVDNLSLLQPDTTPYSPETELAIFSYIDTSGNLVEDSNYILTDGSPLGTRKIPSNLLFGDCFISIFDSGGFAKQLGNTLFFNKCLKETGQELWSMNLLDRSTSFLGDIAQGPTDSYPQFSKDAGFGNNLLFLADDEIHGRELWISDGTPEGTKLFLDSIPGIESGFSYKEINKNHIKAEDYFLLDLIRDKQSAVFFTYDRTAWVTNGTQQGTFSIGSFSEVFGQRDFEDEAIDNYVPRFDNSALFYTSQINGAAALSLLRSGDSRIPYSYIVNYSNKASITSTVSKVYFAGLTQEHIYLFSELFDYDPRRSYPEDPWASGLTLLVADRDQCPYDDRKTEPGLCGCGIMEVPATLNDRDAVLSANPENQVLCVNSEGSVVFSPNNVSAVSAKIVKGKKTKRKVGKSLQINLPKNNGVQRANVIAAAQTGSAGKASSDKSLQTKHKLRIVKVDEETGEVSLFRRTNTTAKKLEIPYSRSLKPTEKLIFQYGFDLQNKQENQEILNSSVLSQADVTFRKK